MHGGQNRFPVAELTMRSAIGRLGRPLGAIVAIEGTVADASSTRAKTDEGETLLRVRTADCGCTTSRAPWRSSWRGADPRLIARLINADIGTRVFYARQPGYDTHSGQLVTHYTLLNDLGEALKALHDDLTAARLADKVAVMAFSEFGRTVKENVSRGTDHGTAGPVFVLGLKLNEPLIGETPSLTDLDPGHGDLRVGIDFRRVYATLLDDWLGLPAEAALGQKFEPRPLFKA
jgi:uncharacterized protein (DUF1501 family)